MNKMKNSECFNGSYCYDKSPQFINEKIENHQVFKCFLKFSIPDGSTIVESTDSH